MNPVVGTILTGVGAVATAGMGIFNSMRGGPSAPDFGPPPAPANYYTYDEEGNLAGSQEWDEGRHAYIYRPAPLTPEQKAEKERRQSLKTQMLANLDKTPADRVQAYTDYAKAISEGLHKDVDYQFEKLNTAKNEELAARGLFGSRAYVDTQKELAKQKTEADIEIANRAELGKENLANQDRNFWLQTLGALDQNTNSQALIAAQNVRNIQTGGQLATQDLLAGYNDYNAPRFQQWQTQIAQSNQNTQNLMNTATGLAFLYGFMRDGSSSKSGEGKGSGIVNRAIDFMGIR